MSQFYWEVYIFTYMTISFTLQIKNLIIRSDITSKQGRSRSRETMWSDIVDAISYYALFCTGVITEQNYQQYSAKYRSFNALTYITSTW